MRTLWRKCPVRAAVLALLSVGLTGEAPVSIRVEPVVAFAPADLRVQTWVEANDENRRLQVIAESGEFYRSSEVPLDGERAPRTFMFEMRSLPAGDYVVRAVLTRQGAREIPSLETSLRILDGGKREQ